MKVSSAQLSSAVGGVHVTTALQLSVSTDCEMSAGIPLMVGEMVSSTVTSKLAVATLPSPSIAEYVTVVVPSSKVDPLLCVPVRLASVQLSVAVGAVHVTSAEHPPAGAAAPQ